MEKVSKKSISRRVLALLANSDKPLKPDEIARQLGLKKRRFGYYWGRWSFRDAEKKGLIVWDEVHGGWKLKR